MRWMDVAPSSGGKNGVSSQAKRPLGPTDGVKKKQPNVTKSVDSFLRPTPAPTQSFQKRPLNSQSIQRVETPRPNYQPDYIVEEPRIRRFPVIVVLLGALLLVGGGIVFASLLRGGGIAWVEDYGDYSLEYVAQTELKLKISADNNVLKGVKVEGGCDRNHDVDTPEYKDGEIKWNIKNGSGVCTLRAKYQLKTIEKTFKVISQEMESEELGLEDIYRTKLKADADDDQDGLLNKDEKKVGTKADLTDSDGDGLSDGNEVIKSKTDPLKADSDNDGLSDLCEKRLGLNPLKSDTKGDGRKDGERKVSYKYSINGVKLKVSGSGNIADATIDVTSGAALSKKTGLIPRLYSFHASGKIDEATVVIAYSDVQLQNARIQENKLTLYRYDLGTEEYEAVKSTVDSTNKIVTAKIDDFAAYYVLGASNTKSLDKTGSELMFVLDNSWSMYTNDQYKEITGEEYPRGKLAGTDPDGQRFKYTGELVEKMSNKGMSIGLAEFRGDYAQVNKVSADTGEIQKSLNDMNGKFLTEKAGTNIENAIRRGAKEFSKNAKLKTLILLTDGRDNYNLSANAEILAEEMAAENVRVCVLGFSEGAYSKEVSLITAKTGCKFFSSSDVNGLSEIFKNLEILLSDELADVDGDGKMDGLLMADSGFIVTRDGFSFKNYSSTLMPDGHCYGMATFAQLYYAKKMPLQHDAIEVSGVSSYGYNLNSDYFKDYQNLYDYRLQSEALKYNPQIGYGYFGEKAPADKFTVKNGVISYKDSIKKEIDKSSLYEYYSSNTKDKSDTQIQKYGFSYSKIEKVRLSESKMQDSAAMNGIDRSLFNAIYASQIRQPNVKMYSSGSAVSIDLGDHAYMKNSANSNDFMVLLRSRLQEGEAPMILAYFSGGLHAMNAINLVQDVRDPNHYYVGVYDSNYPGEKRYLELQCSKFSCSTQSNKYYNESGEVIRMSISEEEDMSHFETVPQYYPYYY